MNNNNFQMIFARAALVLVSLGAGPMAWAQSWTSFDNNTRYLALGDSLSAGYEAKPVTQGFVYQLYQGGVIDSLNNLLFCTEAVPNATSTGVRHGGNAVHSLAGCIRSTGADSGLYRWKETGRAPY
jgi:lysophospholipase L1-like esterase